MTASDRLSTMGLTLPEATAPAANYLPAVRSGDLIFLSGHLCKRDGHIVRGSVGVSGDWTSTEAADLARLAAIDLLGSAAEAAGGVNNIEQVVKVTGYVRSTADFTDQPLVINGASDFFVEVFGDAGRHARASVGVSALPLGAAVEIDAIVRVKT